jgi:hypothetical protein
VETSHRWHKVHWQRLLPTPLAQSRRRSQNLKLQRNTSSFT